MKTEKEIRKELNILKDCLANKDLCDPGSPVTERVIGKVEILLWILGEKN